MERLIGTTFKDGDDELIVEEIEKEACRKKDGKLCYYYNWCAKNKKIPKIAGLCYRYFRKDRKSVIFTKK